MRPDYFLCDRCGAKVPSGKRIAFCVDRVPNGAGSEDDVVYEVDACHDCALAALMMITRSKSNPMIRDVEISKRLFEYLTKDIIKGV